ncbi:MAG: TetR/AcrR family transcriptional regulator [Lachnospiraceae bacterium]|nr:TetR/AcrR family transcriptional regulator [Lachnospiraceae bacterium]
MNETKQKILDVALDMFSQKGFSAVSIRDICKVVDIKESSVYYHFKNKQAIFDELLQYFETIANDLMSQLEQGLTVMPPPDNFEGNFFEKTCNCFFEDYLMDEYCNKIMRLLSIEHLHNDEMQKIYDYWIFDKPLSFQTKVFSVLTAAGIVKATDSHYLAVKFYSPIFLFMQRFLFGGALTEECKQTFRENAYQHVNLFFNEIGTE